jgi:hypothetical protein
MGRSVRKPWRTSFGGRHERQDVASFGARPAPRRPSMPDPDVRTPEKIRLTTLAQAAG